LAGGVAAPEGYRTGPAGKSQSACRRVRRGHERVLPGIRGSVVVRELRLADESQDELGFAVPGTPLLRIAGPRDSYLERQAMLPDDGTQQGRSSGSEERVPEFGRHTGGNGLPGASWEKAGV